MFKFPLPSKSHKALPQVLSFCSVCGLSILIFLNFDLLPLHKLMLNNADLLFMEDIARDLNSGGHLFDWRLPNAPALFPDILLSRIICFFGAELGSVAAYCEVISGVIVVALLSLIAAYSKADVKAVLPFAGVIFLLSFIGQLNGDIISIYFGLVHSGVLITVACQIILIWGLLTESIRIDLALLGIFFTATIGFYSDGLSPVAILPGLAAYFIFFFVKKNISITQCVAIAAVLLLGVFFSRAISFINPFPQDREHFAWHISRFPHLVELTLLRFVRDFVFYLTHSLISALVLLLTIASYSICLSEVVAAVLGKAPPNKPTVLLSSIVVTSIPIVLSMQIIFGFYENISTSRQWAPLIYFSIVSAAIVSCTWDKVVPVIISYFTVGLSLLFATILSFGVTNGALRPSSNFAPLLACMDNNTRPGWNYIADYWIARPVRLYSNGRYGVVPYEGSVGVFSPDANVRWIRESHPSYVIAGLSVKAHEYQERFGSPEGVYCDMTLPNGTAVQILDYSHNQEFTSLLRTQAATAK